MRYPAFLKEGSTVGICAPSAGVGHKIESFDASEAVLARQGWDLIETEHVRVNDLRGGTGGERSEELSSLFLDDDVDAVFCAAGGDFLCEMLPHVNWETLRDHPKWLMGASDPTGLLFPYTTLCDVATLYGSNGGSFDTLVSGEDGQLQRPEYLQGILSFLKGQTLTQKSWDRYLGADIFEMEDGPVTFPSPARYAANREAIHASGRCIGGCIDVLKDLIGTPWDGTEQFLSCYKEDGVIWYFDNFALSSAVLYRTLLQMRWAGWITPETTKAVLIGRTLFEREEAEMSYEDAIRRALPDIPAVWEADIGHTIPHFFMVNGAMLDAEWRDGALNLQFSLS